MTTWAELPRHQLTGDTRRELVALASRRRYECNLPRCGEPVTFTGEYVTEDDQHWLLFYCPACSDGQEADGARSSPELQSLVERDRSGR